MQDVSAALGGLSPTRVALKVGGEKDKSTPASGGGDRRPGASYPRFSFEGADGRPHPIAFVEESRHAPARNVTGAARNQNRVPRHQRRLPSRGRRRRRALVEKGQR